MTTISSDRASGGRRQRGVALSSGRLAEVTVGQVNVDDNPEASTTPVQSAGHR